MYLQLLSVSYTLILSFDDCIFLSEFTILQADQYIFVSTAGSDVVSNDHLCVLLGPHPQVLEVRVPTIQLLQGLLRLHYQVSDQGSVLNTGNHILRVELNWNAYITKIGEDVVIEMKDENNITPIFLIAESQCLPSLLITT